VYDRCSTNWYNNLLPVFGSCAMQSGTEFFRYQIPVTNRTCSILVTETGASDMKVEELVSEMCELCLEDESERM